MKSSPRSRTAPKGTRTVRAVATGPAAVARAKARKRSRNSPTNIAIATDLAPAVAIALLAKTDQAPDAPAPALQCLAAGVSPAEDDDKVRVQLVFDNGAVLPVEMSVAAGEALSTGLSEELAPKE